MEMAYRSQNTQPSEKQNRVVFTFVSSPTSSKSPSSHKRPLSESLQGQRWFEDGLLMNTLEKGVLFPTIHYIELPDNNKPPMLVLDGSVNAKDARLQQGMYKEIRNFSPGMIGKSPSHVANGTSFKACIFMGFKTLDDTFNEVLEDNWKDWTGARAVYMNLSDEFGLSKFTFYRRLIPKDLEIFTYIMTVECEWASLSNKIKLLDFVQRFRVERMIGYLSVYKVTPKVPSTAQVISGLLSEAVDTGSEETSI